MSILDGMVIDNYHDNPDEIREYALSLDYDVIGNYPGFRCERLPEKFMDQQGVKMEEVLGVNVHWGDICTRPVTFQWSHDGHISWVHQDIYPDWVEPCLAQNLEVWAGVLFLTPNAPVEAGTGLYTHKRTGKSICEYEWRHAEGKGDWQPGNGDTASMDEWDLNFFAGNVYNRFVTYRARNFHRNICSFGDNKMNGRLTQLSFFCLDKDL